MNILVNAIPLTGLLTGIARYVRNLYLCLEQEPGFQAGYFTGRRIESAMPVQNGHESWIIKNNRLRRLPESAMFALRSAHWLNYERRLRKCGRHQGYDLYHETGFVPAKLPELPVVYTMYDLSLRHYAHAHPRERVWFFEYFIKRRLPQARHILTISQYIRSEIIEEFKVPQDKVTAVPLAPAAHFVPRAQEQVSQVLDKLNVPADYLLFTGTLEPRKNIDLLIKALPLMQHKLPLVLAGWSGWGHKAWQEELISRGLRNRVLQTGYLDEEDLACLYSGARAFVYPSLYEGFGLPVLEAMACGCPVVTSRASCLPETAGQAALYTDPYAPEELAGHLDQIIENQQLSQDLSRRGLRRAASFTWQHTANQTLQVFQSIAH